MVLLKSSVVTFCILIQIGSLVEGQNDVSPRIRGGDFVSIKDNPFVVRLKIMNATESYQKNCGGTILDEYHIITAAQCVYGQFDVYIYAGCSNLWRTHECQIVKVAEKFIHPDFKLNTCDYSYDIAVLTLEEPLLFNENVGAISKLSESEKQTEWASALGWGNSDRLQEIELAIVPCRPDKRPFHQSIFCAIGHGDNSPCEGDAGGPYVIDNVLYGVISRLPGRYTCKFTSRYTVFSEISNVTDFIMDVVRQSSTLPTAPEVPTTTTIMWRPPPTTFTTQPPFFIDSNEYYT